ncbi:MAG: hypothetical protein ACYC6Y_20225, partial [Thermoguttaceae bacterium]
MTRSVFRPRQLDPRNGCRPIAVLLAFVAGAAGAWADTGSDPLKLTLPPVIYAVPGLEMSLYYDNVVVTQTPEAFRFTVTCPMGKGEERRWTAIPTPA